MDILSTAAKEIGVTSDVNGKVNPRVLEYFAKIGATYEPGDDQVWCAAFVGFILETCGIPSTRALNARSYLSWGATESNPQPGDVVVFWRDSVASTNGHVSFLHHQDENTVYCLGGNQGSGIVDIEAYPKSRVLGYRRAITTNTETNMEPIETTVPPAETPVEITPETKQVLIVRSIAVTWDKSINGEIVSTGQVSTIKPTPELVAALSANDSNMIEPNWTIEVTE